MLFKKIMQFAAKTCFILKTRKPLLVIKMAILTLKAMVSKKALPFRQVEIQTTFACNLQCIHCSATNFKINGEMLSLNDYKEIARQCKLHGIPMISFTGGEPLFDPRLEDIIKIFDTRSTLISITTNGTLLTPERAKKLKSLGVDCFTISLDGPNPETNDPIRGVGTFERSLKAIQTAKQHGFLVMVIHVLSHVSIQNKNFDAMLRLAQGLNISLHVSLASPTGNWADVEAIKKFILKKKDIEYLWDCQKKYPFLRRDLDGNYLRKGCPAGVERFVISPYGGVLPCTKIQASFGNVKKEPMLDIRNRMAGIGIFCNYPLLCLAAEDDRFLATYMPSTFKRKDLP